MVHTAYYNNDKKKLSGRSNTDLIAPGGKPSDIASNPYLACDVYSKTGGTSSRDSSMTKTSLPMKKPPTVPKPFRLSASNCRKRKDEDVTPQGSQDRTPKATGTFKAKKLPKSHRVPFMVLHSTKNLTHPEMFSLKTKERSQSRQRSGSNKQDSQNREEVPKSTSKYTCINFSKMALPVKYAQKIPIKTDKILDLFDIDIDKIINAEESKNI